jgi:MFS family permease
MYNDKHIRNQLRKFGFYGLLKNLKFFDPFLIYYLWQSGIDLTGIGFLIAIREVIIYIFEIPSGVIADKFGKRNELVLCFLFYIGAFILFFIGGNYYIFVLAYALFGLGEAFRSGTHKAMIMDFLEYHELNDSKAKVYGKTRSYSMIGSSLSSFIAIGLVIYLPNINLLFLVSIIPYVLDLLLVLSYPDYLNTKDDCCVSFRSFMYSMFKLVYDTLLVKRTRRLLIDSSLYNAIFKTIKDYVQPILETLMMGIILITVLDSTENVEVILAITYAVIFMISAFASRFSYVFLNKFRRDSVLKSSWLTSLIVYILLFIFIDSLFAVIGLFILIYVIQNVRKPLMVGKIADNTSKTSKASTLSVESQLTSVFIIAMAPSLGALYDNFGARYVFVALAAISLVMFFIKEKEH